MFTNLNLATEEWRLTLASCDAGKKLTMIEKFNNTFYFAINFAVFHCSKNLRRMPALTGVLYVSKLAQL